MASTIVTKNSSTASAVPVSGDLTQGELAVNVTDKRLFTKNSGGTVVELGTNPASLALPNGTANGVAYLNGSKVLTTGSALTFDGTNLGLGVTPSAWSIGKAQEFNTVGNAVWSTGANDLRLLANIYYNGGYKYATTASASMYQTNGGSHSWYIAPSGTAGNAITFTQAMTLDSSGRALIGYTTSQASGYSLQVNTDAYIYGVTVGRGAGAVASNTAVGASALASGSLSGGSNVGVGYYSLTATTSGANNTATGNGSMEGNTTGAENSAFGSRALRFNTTGNYNTAVGRDALFSNTTASNNTAVGYQAGYSNTTGVSGVYVGYQAGYSNQTGANNTIIGDRAGYSVTGSQNTFLGEFAGNAATTGTYNTFLGYGSGYLMTTGSKNTIVGFFAGNQGGLDIRTASNYVVLSDGDGNPRGIFDGSGNFFVGKTALGNAVGISMEPGGTSGIRVVNSSSTNSADGFQMYSTGAAAFRFYVSFAGTVNATNTTITAISDQRLKENIRDLDDGLEKVMALQPRKFDWKEGKGADIKNARGFIAQEFETVFPDMIEEWRDPAPEGEEPYKAVNANLIPTLVKAIQEQQAIIEQLKADVAALKGA